MARSFGKPTNGGFHAGTYASRAFSEAWFYEFPRDVIYSNVLGEGFLIHKGVQPDEEVWLTREGVAKGEDDVVKRALAWMSSLTYAHNVGLHEYYGRPGVDSLTVVAVLANPLRHQSAISAVVTGGAVHDSVLFYNDGLHGDDSAGDSVWGARLLAPAAEGTFSVSVETKDLMQVTSRRLPDIALLTTAGPLALDSIEYLDDRASSSCQVLPYVKNMGSAAPFKHGTVSLVCTDSWVDSIRPAMLTFNDIAPGQTDMPGGNFWIYYNPSKIPGHLNLTFELGFEGHTCWSASKILITGVAEEKQTLPTVYALEQNYPNPFNPKTGVRFSVPTQSGRGLVSTGGRDGQVSGVSDVKITVYDILGREVAILVNERKVPGRYEVTFDGSGFASGVYIYRMTAGSFVETRKLTLLK
jgi:hypothetical protein